MGLFLTFEGIDGSGKSTQIGLTERWLKDEGYSVLVRREPGGTDLGEAIRAILLDPRWTAMHPRAEYLLYSASRAQLVEAVVRPYLLNERSVMILDRYMDSSTAYQGGGREIGAEVIAAIHPFVTGGLVPDLTIYLDLDWATSQTRRAHEQPDRLEQNAHDFFDRVRTTYVNISKKFPERVVRIDASGSVEEVFARIQRRIRGKL
ncbi:dTMP kinase [candidate division KSB1 bacterium]|nr:dTMP kinase [candidate division KSB1 bacterium]